MPSWSSPATSRADEVKADAEETYGKVADARRPIAPRNRPKEPVQEAPRTVTLADSRVEQPSVTPRLSGAFGNHRQAWRKRGARCARPCDRQRRDSRLYRTLVVDKGIALNAGAYYSGTALDYGKFGVYGAPKPGVSLHEVEDGIDGVLADVIAHGITADELDRAKTRLIADAVYAQDNQATLARWYGAALASGQTVDMVRAWPDRIRAVTADAVQTGRASTWLDRRHSVTGYLVKACSPRRTIRECFRAHLVRLRSARAGAVAMAAAL